MTTLSSSPRGSMSPGGERSQRFTNAAMAGGRVSSAKHHSYSVPETISPKASRTHIPGSFPESHQSPAPVNAGTEQDAAHEGHDHRPILKVDLPTHEEPTGAREGVGSLPGPNTDRGVAILPDEKKHLHDGSHKRKADHQHGAKREKVAKVDLPSTEQPSGSRTGIGSMPGSNSEAGVATLPEERIDGRPYGQGHTGFEESLDSGRPTQHHRSKNRCPVDPVLMGLDSDFNDVKMPAEQPREMDSDLAKQVQRVRGGQLKGDQALAQGGETEDATSMGISQHNALGAMELAEVPIFLEGGFESTAAGGKYEVVFERALALPAPGEAATSKEPSQPIAPFSQRKSVSRQPPVLTTEHQAVEEVAEVPVFIEGGSGSTVAGGKYEAVFKPALSGPGGVTKPKATSPTPGSASYLGQPVSKEEEMAQIEKARRLASKKEVGIN